MKTPQEKALKKVKKSTAASFFDSLDRSLGNGRYGTKNPRLAVLPKKK